MTKQMKVRKPKIKKINPEKEAQGEFVIPKNSTLPMPDIPEYDSKFTPIIEHVTKIDPQQEWKEIGAWLATEPKSLYESMELLAQKPDISVRAKRLYRSAKREFTRFEIDWKEKTGIMRDLARDYWEERKKQGMRKQITNDMVDDWIIEHYGDVWKEMYTRYQDMKNAVSVLEHLSTQVDDRAPDLRRFIDTYKENKEKPGWMDSQKRKNRGRK